MKKLLTVFAPCLMLSTVVFAKRITMDIPDEEIKIVEHDVINAEQWLLTAWKMKVAGCRERLVKQEVDESIKNKESIPAGDEAILQKALNRPGYKSRSEREIELERERQLRIRTQ